MRETENMKRFIAIFSILIVIGCLAHVLAQDSNRNTTDYYAVQGELMKSGPPEFMLVSEVDLNAKTITAFQTKEIRDQSPRIIGHHRSFKFSEIEVTNARRKKLDESEIKNLNERLVILSTGEQQLSAAYLGMFIEDTIVVTFSPKTK